MRNCAVNWCDKLCFLAFIDDNKVDTVSLHFRKMQILYKVTAIFRTEEMQISYNKISNLFLQET